MRKAIGVDALAADVPQDIHGIDLGPSPTPYERAERLAAEAFGAERTWFLTNGATQGNHALCLALAPLGHADRRAAQLARVDRRRPRAQRRDPELRRAGVRRRSSASRTASRPTRSRPRWREAPDARAAFIVSPTYYGMAADVAGLRRGRPRAGVPLVVDQSWGPHFGFHEQLPPTALSQGADAMLTSTHKIAGSLTQSAMLHVGNRSGRDRIDIGAVARALRLLRSTSPSSLLLASLDGARRQLVLHGEQLLHETLEAIAVARAKLETIPGIALVDASLVGRMGVAGYDPLRIVLDVRGTGRTGYEIADALRRSYDVHLELPDAGDDRVRRRARRVGGRAAAPGGRHRRDRQARRAAGRDGRARPADDDRCATRSPSRRARRSSARPSSSRSTTPSAGSRASRSPATRRACRRCCRASGSRPRPSPTCASSRRAARACTARATPGSRPSTCSGRSR